MDRRACAGPGGLGAELGHLNSINLDTSLVTPKVCHHQPQDGTWSSSPDGQGAMKTSRPVDARL